MRPLSPQTFAILSSLIEERVGLHYGPQDIDSFEDKLHTRMSEAGFESALDYYYFLRYDDPDAVEFSMLVDALVIGETYFFREIDALRCAVRHLIGPAIAARGYARVWHAACATGEEPLSLAMLLAEAGLLSQTSILATDVSSRALERARSGVRGPRSLRSLDPQAAALAQRWLTRNGDRVAVNRALIDAVQFRRSNLLDAAAIDALGTFDVVFCRNVLIYFRDEVVHQVARSLARAIAPDGRLIVGASESLLRFGTIFRGEERAGTFLYHRRGDSP